MVYLLPTTQEQAEKARRDWRETLRSLPTWHLELWLADPRGDWQAPMLLDELSQRSDRRTE
jgi:hypothetical protein